jgi:hypothetical protein
MDANTLLIIVVVILLLGSVAGSTSGADKTDHPPRAGLSGLNERRRYIADHLVEPPRRLVNMTEKSLYERLGAFSPSRLWLTTSATRL